LSSTEPGPAAPGGGAASAPRSATLRAYPDVVEAYLEELGFLGLQRRALLFSHEIGIEELDEHERRIDAQLDGLSHAGEEALEAIEERLGSDDPWEAYAGARAWIEVARPDPGTLAARIDAAPAEQLPSWIEALRDLGEGARSFPDGPAARAVLLAASPWSGPVDPAMVGTCAADESVLLRRAAARAAVGTHADDAHRVLPLCDDPDPLVRNAALWSVCLLDPASAAERLRGRIRNGPDPFGVRILGLFGGEADHDALCELAVVGEAAVRAAAVHALGSLGFARTLDFLAGRLPFDEPVAAAAADAWSRLTGLSVQEPGEDEGEEQAEEEAEGGPVPDDEVATPRGWPREDSYESERIRRGRPMGDGEDLEALWRRSVEHPERDLDWLRIEVPAGFFEDVPVEDMRPGE
jgi:hypothetical protein